MTHFHRASVAACALLACSMFGSPLRADCWTEDRHSYADEILKPAAEKATLAADVATIGAESKADRRLGAISGYRLQLNSYIGFPVDDEGSANYADIWVGLHDSDVWQAGCAIDQDAADAAPDATVRISINDGASLQSVADAPDDTALAPFPEPVSTSANHGRPIYGDRVLVVAPKGVTALMPYLVRDHFAEWKTRLKEIGEAGAGDYSDQELAALEAYEKGEGAAQLGKQTAFTNDMKPETAMWAYGLADAENARPRVYLNPALKKAAPMTSRFMVVSIELYKDDPALADALANWLRETDFTFLQDRLK